MHNFSRGVSSTEPRSHRHTRRCNCRGVVWCEYQCEEEGEKDDAGDGDNDEGGDDSDDEGDDGDGNDFGDDGGDDNNNGDGGGSGGGGGDGGWDGPQTPVSIPVVPARSTLQRRRKMRTRAWGREYAVLSFQSGREGFLFNQV